MIPISITEDYSMINDFDNRLDNRKISSLRSKKLIQINLDRSSDSMSQLQGANHIYSLQVEDP